MSAQEPQERAPAPATPPRALLYFIAVTLQLIASALSGVGFLLEAPGWCIGGILAWLAWFACLFLMTRPATDGMLRGREKPLKQASAAIFGALLLAGILEIIAMTVLYPRYVKDNEDAGAFGEVITGLKESFQYNDSTVLIQQAAENLLDGENPYARADIIAGLTEYGAAYDRVTPVRTGRFAEDFPYPALEDIETVVAGAVASGSAPPEEVVNGVAYPAGSFLLPAPFLALGISDIRIVYGIFAAAGLVYAAWLVKGKKRWVFIGGAAASLEFWNSIAAGETGLTCFPLLMAAWLGVRRNWWVSALFMGLAVASKQTAWFVLPFYLILCYHTAGKERFPAAFGIIAGVFAACNLPFIFMDAGLWLRSVVSPMAGPLFPLGVGIVNIVGSGLVDIRSPLVFTVLEAAGIAGGLAWYWRNCRKYPAMGLVLAVAPLFLAWRSLWTYFFHVGIIAFAAVMAGDDGHESRPRWDMKEAA